MLNRSDHGFSGNVAQAGFFKFVAAKTALWFAIAMALVAGPPMASAKFPMDSDTADLQLSDVLPYRPGVYVWCDNAPLAFDSLFEFVSKTGKRNNLSEILSQLEQHGEDAAVGDGLAIMAKTLRRLRKGIFDSQAMWIYTADNDAEFCRSFIAHSSSSTEEIQELMTGLQSLVASGQQDQGDAQKEQGGEWGHWSFDNGWLVWSQQPEEMENLHHWIQQGTEKCLAKNRSFQMALASASRSKRHWPSISLFVSSEIIPTLLVSGNPCKELLDISGQADWAKICNAAFVNELRGLGGQIYLPNDDLANRLNSALAFDLFLLVAAPRCGLFAAVESREGITFDVPTVDKPLAQFVQIEVNGGRLADGIKETNHRVLQIADMEYAFGRAAKSDFFLNLHSLNKIDGPSSPELLREISKVMSVEYFEKTSSDEVDSGSLDIWNAIKVGNSDRTLDAVTQALNDQQPGTWSSAQDGDITNWSIAAETRAKMSKNLQEKLRNKQEKGDLQFTGPVTIQLKISGGGDDSGGGGLVLGDGNTLSFEMPDLMQIMRDQFNEKLAQYLSQSYVRVGDWMYVRPIQAANLEKIPETQMGVGTGQLDELKAEFDKINSEFDSTPCGILAQWPKRMARNLQSVLPNHRSDETPDRVQAAGDESDLESLVRELTDYRQSVAKSIEKLVVVLDDEDSGFRIVGSVTRSPAQNAAQQPDDN